MLDNTFKTSTLCRSRIKGGIFWFLKLSNLRNIPLCNWVRQKGLRQKGSLSLVPLKTFLATANPPLEPGPSRHLKHHPHGFWKSTHVAHRHSALPTSTATHLQLSSLVTRRQLSPTPQSHRPPPIPPPSQVTPDRRGLTPSLIQTNAGLEAELKSPFCDQSMAAEADWAGQVFPKKENLKQMVPPGSAGGSFTAYMYMRLQKVHFTNIYWMCWHWYLSCKGSTITVRVGCCGLNCVPWIHRSTPSSLADGAIGRWWHWDEVRRLSPRMGLLPAQEETPESLVSLAPHHVRRRLSASQDEGPHQTWPWWPPHLGLPAARTVSKRISEV